MDRESALSLPISVSNSQFYSVLSPIVQTPVEKENNDILSSLVSNVSTPTAIFPSGVSNTPVYELTEEVCFWNYNI